MGAVTSTSEELQPLGGAEQAIIGHVVCIGARFNSGDVAEWLKASVSKTDKGFTPFQRFKSSRLRHEPFPRTIRYRVRCMAAPTSR